MARAARGLRRRRRVAVGRARARAGAGRHPVRTPSTPQLIAAGYAVVGIIVGIAIAVCALVARAAAANVLITASWLWVLAIATVIDGVLVGRGLGTAPLGVWPFGDDTYFRSTWSLPGALLMLGVALVIGVGAAWRAARRGDSRIGTSLSGALGPLLVAIAYFLTVPRLVGLDDPQFSAYLLAPYALIAGLTGSVLFVAALASRERPGHAASGRPAGAFGRAPGAVDRRRCDRGVAGAHPARDHVEAAIAKARVAAGPVATSRHGRSRSGVGTRRRPTGRQQRRSRRRCRRRQAVKQPVKPVIGAPDRRPRRDREDRSDQYTGGRPVERPHRPTGSARAV